MSHHDIPMFVFIIIFSGIPLVTGFIVSRALADPVLNFTLQNNEEAFAMNDRQKIEGAHAVHVEETRMRMDAALGKVRRDVADDALVVSRPDVRTPTDNTLRPIVIPPVHLPPVASLQAPPVSEEHLIDHLREFAHELEEEERHHNEQNLITVVSDSVSGIMLFGILAQKTRGRQALFNTISRLFEGLSDIAKAVLIILIADTLLGYHSEEGWTGFLELVLGHYGVEAEEEGVVIFVGVVSALRTCFGPAAAGVGISPAAGVGVSLEQSREGSPDQEYLALYYLSNLHTCLACRSLS